MTRVAATSMLLFAIAECGAAPPAGPAVAAPAGSPTVAARPVTTTTPPPLAPVANGLPIGKGDFGTPGPTLLRGLDEQGRWMALCQARKDTDGDGKIEIYFGHHGDFFGDAMEQFLVLGGGEGTPIDYLVAQSEDGRWVAVIRGGELQLVDTTTGGYSVMAGADLKADGRPGMRHRAAVFAGNQLVFVRTADKANDRLVVLDLATQKEKELPVTGRAWRMAPESARRLAVYTVGLGDEFPSLHTTLARGECLGQPRSYGTYGQSGPVPTQRFVDLTTGTETTSSDTAIAIGDELVHTPASGGIFIDSDPIAPRTCRAMIMAVLENPARVVAQCTEGKRRKIWLFGRELATELETVKGDGFYSDHTSMLEAGTGVVCDAGLFCINVQTNERIDLQGGVATYVFGNWIYVVHATTSSRKFEVIDIASGKRTKLETTDSRRAAGKFVLDSDWNLIDLEQGKVIGNFGKLPDERVIALNPQGQLLLAAAEGQGPYQWKSL